MKTDKIELMLKVPGQVSVAIDAGMISIKGPKGEIKRSLSHPRIKISADISSISLVSLKPGKREKKMISTFNAHLKNMLKGVVDLHAYSLKVCSGHFPMNVSTTKDELVIKNFLGEKNPRKVKISPGVSVKIDGDIVSVESVDKELAGQQAASIEKLCRISNRDLRIFQDGIWIIKKGEKGLQR